LFTQHPPPCFVISFPKLASSRLTVGSSLPGSAIKLCKLYFIPPFITSKLYDIPCIHGVNVFNIFYSAYKENVLIISKNLYSQIRICLHSSLYFNFCYLPIFTFSHFLLLETFLHFLAVQYGSHFFSVLHIVDRAA
jgi:hypothetical protein